MIFAMRYPNSLPKSLNMNLDIVFLPPLIRKETNGLGIIKRKSGNGPGSTEEIGNSLNLAKDILENVPEDFTNT